MPHAQRISTAGTLGWRLSGAATTWSIAGALAAIYLISTLPTPMYAVYRQTFGFSPVTLPTSGMIAGLAALIPGVVMLVLAERAHSLVPLLAASIAVGVACGLGYRFGSQVVNEMAPADRRAALVSAYLIVCYVAISVPVIGVGLVAAAWTPLAADTIFGGLVAVLAIAALVIHVALHRRQTR